MTQKCMSYFWDGNSRLFRALVLSTEAVSSDAQHDRGYTLWPSLVGLHALVEGGKSHPGRYTKQIATVYDGLEQYWSPELSAYTSWVRFPGNSDAYYDDNAWAVIVLTEAYIACRASNPERAKTYLERAKTVMAGYVVKGYDATGKPGGTRWGTDTTKPNTSDRGTSSTAGSALAALLLARVGVNPKFYTAWGHDLLTWLTTWLLDSDDLIMDAIVEPNWDVRRVKWTYNTGVPLRAYVEHYRLTRNPQSLAMATRLAHAALDPQKGLFDQTVRDAAKRSYWDGIYFVHYLADGLLHIAQVSPDKALADHVAQTLTRTARYARTFLRDPTDGLYWRNFRAYKIGETQRATWQKWTGQVVAADYDLSERSQEKPYAASPVEERPLVKTLLANAGAARLFWLVARLPAS